MNKLNTFRMKIEVDGIPMMDKISKHNNEAELDDMVRDLKRKLFGK